MRANRVIRSCLLTLVALTSQQGLGEELQITQQEKQILVGHMMAAVAFCGLGSRIDAFKMGQQMKVLGLSSNDRPDIEKDRGETYSKIRSSVLDPTAHEQYCREMESNPLLIAVMRKTYDLSRGSDSTQQQEKIKTYGDALGVMDFCGVSVDREKLGRKLYSSGLTGESITAVQARSRARRSSLEWERGQMKGSPNACSELQSNAFVKQVAKTQ
jgi:hypothetical protein